MKRSLWLSFPVCLSCLLSACGGGGTTAPPPTATHFSVSAPMTAIGGTAFQVTVTALDASNNVVATYTGTVHFTCTDGQAVLPTNSTLTNGTGMFSATLKNAGSQTITATDTVTASITGTSTSINVNTAAPTHFSVTAPAAATAGMAFNLTVTALDASNNTVTTYSGTVHFTSSDSQAMLPANSTLTNGTGTFSATLKTSGSQTITATDTVTPTITGVSNAIQIPNAAPAGTFTPAGSMAFPRTGHTATMLKDGTVLIIGGENSTGPLASAEIYNPATGMFTTQKGMMETARVGHTATLLTDGSVLVTGGNDATGPLASAEIFDTATGMFTYTTGNMEIARAGHTATLLNDGTGRVLVAGGGSSSAELFEPSTEQFTPVTMDMLASMTTATLLPSGQVLLEGGGIAQGDLFNPSTATFTATANGGPTANSLSAALLADGSVLLAGGRVIQPNSLCYYGVPSVSVSTATLFDSSSGTFLDISAMNYSRVGHTATPLNGGEVLIAGGSTINFQFCDRGLPHYLTLGLANAELYNPASGTFTLTGNMSTARTGHTATLLGNGQVLLVGGVDAKGNALASAELFQ